MPTGKINAHDVNARSGKTGLPAGCAPRKGVDVMGVDLACRHVDWAWLATPIASTPFLGHTPAAARQSGPFSPPRRFKAGSEDPSIISNSSLSWVNLDSAWATQIQSKPQEQTALSHPHPHPHPSRRRTR